MQKTLVKKKKISINLIIDFIVGYVRYFLYYSRFFGTLMRPHIREQIDYRIKVMHPKCFISGSCKACGCDTTALQMCNRSCDRNCYPKMMSYNKWELFKKLSIIDKEIKSEKKPFIILDIPKDFSVKNFEREKHKLEQQYRNKQYFTNKTKKGVDFDIDNLHSEDISETLERIKLEEEESAEKDDEDSNEMQKKINEIFERDEEKLLEES